MARFGLWMLLALPLAGCGAASASSYDSSDPVQCLTLFGATSGTARTGPLADELNARILYIVRSNGGLPWLRTIGAQSMQVAARFEAAPDRAQVLRLFDDCRDRQDSDPEFRAALPALLPEGRRISAGAR